RGAPGAAPSRTCVHGFCPIRRHRGASHPDRVRDCEHSALRIQGRQPLLRRSGWPAPQEVLPMASLATRPAPAPDGTTAATTGLLTARTADAYQDLLGQVTRDVAERLRTVRAPSVGPDRRHLERLVEGVDLDGPGVGDAAALDEADSLYAAHAVWFHH